MHFSPSLQRPTSFFYFTLGVKLTENRLVVAGLGRTISNFRATGHDLLVILDEERRRRESYEFA